MIGTASAVRAAVSTTVVLVAALLAGVEARAQQPSAPARPRKAQLPDAVLYKYLHEWTAAGGAHAGGSYDVPAASIAGWPDERTREILALAIWRLQHGNPEYVAERAAILARGLLLHTDIGIAERTGKAGSRAGIVDAVLFDGLPLASRPFSVQWSYAGALADALRKSRAVVTARDGRPVPTVDIARAWYRAVGGLFQLWADVGHLDDHLADAGARLGDDPVVLLCEGTLHQTYADARLQAYRARFVGPTAVVGGGTPLNDSPVVAGQSRASFGDARTELEKAARLLRRAIALDASLVEARIRLAHVQEARGKPDEAAALARQALTEPLPAFLEYYAAMVLGRAETALGHDADARAAFQRAAARYPRSQATRVALSRIATRDSARMAAERLLEELGPDPVDVEEDPWAQYWRHHEPDAPSLYDALRASVP